MPREWPLGVRWDAWRNRCATADARRLPAEVTAAFVDRTPIDWTSLLTRASAARDRVFFENLRFLDRLRAGASAERAAPEPSLSRLAIVRVVLTLAGVQTACSLAAVGLAVLTGRAIVQRPSQIVLAAAFAAATLVLAAAASRDRRSLA